MNNIKKFINFINSREFGRDLTIYVSIVLFFTIIFARTTLDGIIFSMLFIVYIYLALEIDSRIGDKNK